MVGIRAGFHWTSEAMSEVYAVPVTKIRNEVDSGLGLGDVLRFLFNDLVYFTCQGDSHAYSPYLLAKRPPQSTSSIS